MMRLGVALLVTGLLSALLWWTAPEELRQPDDIVGYPAFFNFNFLAYRIVV